MSKEYEGRDLMDIAAQAEQDLNNTNGRKGASLSTVESGIDQNVTKKFPGSTAEYGSDATGRTITPKEGGDIQKGTGKVTKAEDFDQGEAGEGPEDVFRRRAEDQGGDNDIRSNIRQHAPQKHTS